MGNIKYIAIEIYNNIGEKIYMNKSVTINTVTNYSSLISTALASTDMYAKYSDLRLITADICIGADSSSYSQNKLDIVNSINTDL